MEVSSTQLLEPFYSYYKPDMIVSSIERRATLKMAANFVPTWLFTMLSVMRAVEQLLYHCTMEEGRGGAKP
jgi:hypothetical protein